MVDLTIYWDRTGTDLFPRNSGDSIDLLQQGRGKGFLDPVDDYDVVNKRYLLNIVPALENKREVVDVTDSVFYNNKNIDISKIFTNYGALTKVQFVLPLIDITDVGKWWEYHVIETQEMDIIRLGVGDIVYQDVHVNTLSTNEPGASLEVVAMRDGYFHVGKVHGNWSYTVVI